MKTPLMLTLLFCVPFAALPSRAEVLVQYNFNTSATFAEVTTEHASVSATAITRVAHSGVNGINYFFYSGGALQLSTSAYGEGNFGIETALARNNYISFTVTASDTHDLSLQSLTFRAMGNSGASERGFFVLSSIGGFNADNVLRTVYSLTGDSNANLPASLTTFTVTESIASTTIAAGESVTFRFYVQTPGAATTIFLDDITLNGIATAVPEPSVVALLAGMAALVGTVIGRRGTRR